MRWFRGRPLAPASEPGPPVASPAVIALCDALDESLFFADAALAAIEEGKPVDSPEVQDALASMRKVNGLTGPVEREIRESRVGPLSAPVPADWPVQPVEPDEPAFNRASCGTCGRSWDDAIITSMTPAPSGRCPFESFHTDEEI